MTDLSNKPISYTGSHPLELAYRALLARAEAAEEEKYQLHKMWSAALDTCDGLRARVAELEVELAAQGWRPVTEEPLVAMQYQVVVQHSRQQPTADHMAYYPSSGWTGTDVIYWRPIPPLPPLPDAPQEPTQ